MKSMNMKAYLLRHLDALKAYCTTQNISYYKLIKNPVSYGDYDLFFLHCPHSSKLTMIDDSKPAKVLLTVTRDGDDLTFEAAPDTSDYL